MVRNSQLLKYILELIWAGLADRPDVRCNRKNDIKEDTKVFSLSNRGSPLPETEEARGRLRLQVVSVQTNFMLMILSPERDQN